MFQNTRYKIKQEQQQKYHYKTNKSCALRSKQLNLDLKKNLFKLNKSFHTFLVYTSHDLSHIWKNVKKNKSMIYNCNGTCWRQYENFRIHITKSRKSNLKNVSFLSI